METVDLKDSFGRIRIHLLPFVRPLSVRHAFPKEAEGIVDYQTALRTAVEHMELLEGERNVLAAHQLSQGL